MPRVCYTLAQRRAKPCAFCLWRMQQKPDDQNVPKDMPSRVDTRKLLEDGVIDEDTYNAIEEYPKENAPEKPEGEQDDTQQPPEKPEDEADDDSADQPELPEIGGRSG